jgi:hypothetical protein
MMGVGWECSSAGRLLTQDTQGPRFHPSTGKKKRRKKVKVMGQHLERALNFYTQNL